MPLPECVSTIEDVRSFFTSLIIDDRLVLHPDDDFGSYVGEGNLRAFDDEQASKRSVLMDQAFEACEREGVDIYLLGMEVQAQQRL